MIFRGTFYTNLNKNSFKIIVQTRTIHQTCNKSKIVVYCFVVNFFKIKINFSTKTTKEILGFLSRQIKAAKKAFLIQYVKQNYK